MRYFALVIAVVGAAVTLLAVMEPYRLKRLLDVRPPVPGTSRAPATRLSRGCTRSRRAACSASGLGNGTSKYDWVPNASTDYVFSVIGEELGLLGCVAVLALFALFAFTGMRISRRSADPFVRLAAGGATVWICGQAVINIGYVTALLPVTGIPLPFISAGGTSLLATFLVFGMLVSFARHEPQAVAAAQRAAAHGARSRLERWLRVPVPKAYVAPKRRPKAPAKAAKRPAPKPAPRGPAKSTAAPRRAVPPARGARPHRPLPATRRAAPPPARRASPPPQRLPRHVGRHATETGMSSPRVLVAGGHSAGHIEPAMNLADAVRRLDPSAEITAVGTERGLDTKLIPARGYPLELIPPVPLPRRPGRALLATPGKLTDAVRAAGDVLRAARDRGRRGLRRVRGDARLHRRAAARHPDRHPRGECAPRRGQPAGRANDAARLHRVAGGASCRTRRRSAFRCARRSPQLDRGRRCAPRRVRGSACAPDVPTLLVTGGSQGARAINCRDAGRGGRPARGRACRCCTSSGRRTRSTSTDGEPPYVVVPYVDQMQYAYAAADFVAVPVRRDDLRGAHGGRAFPRHTCRCPLRGGEQRYNAEPIVQAGGGLLVANVDLSRAMDPATRSCRASPNRRCSMRCRAPRGMLVPVMPTSCWRGTC